MKRKSGQSLSVVLRRSVPKLFLILTAAVPAVVIPSLALGKSKERPLKHVEGQCVSVKSSEPLSKSGRYAIGQTEAPSRVSRLIGDNTLPTPVYTVTPTESVVVPEPKTYAEIKKEEEVWEKRSPSGDQHGMVEKAACFSVVLSL